MSATPSDTELLDRLEKALMGWDLCEIRPTFLSKGHWQIAYKTVHPGERRSGGGDTLREALVSMLDNVAVDQVKKALTR